MKRILVALSLACALAAAIGVLPGCTAPSSAADSAQQGNRAYMSQVNGVMSELGEKLDSFIAATSRADVVNMKTQADDACKTLDELSSIEVPDELSDVQQKYVDGSAKLREALDDYVALFTEVDAGTLDQSTYASRLEAVQSLYDEGVDLLKQADEAAAQKK